MMNDKDVWFDIMDGDYAGKRGLLLGRVDTSRTQILRVLEVNKRTTILIEADKTIPSALRGYP